MVIRFITYGLCLLGLMGCAAAPTDSPVTQPQTAQASALDRPSDWTKGAMATTASGYATDAAMEIIAQGGHAVDAAIAAHLVLGLVEPQSSGIGGGGFLMVFERQDGSLTFHDGRETAPLGAEPGMFMRDGEAMGFLEAWQSGKSIGVPGVVAMYKQAHDKHGQLPWADLFQPAIKLATDGFTVSPRFASLVERIAQYARLDEDPASAAYFYPDGQPLQAGYVRTNPEYAQTLRRIADEGISAFYTGEIAQAIADAAQAAPNAGTLTVQDIANYSPLERPVICGAYRDYNICTASPPSSGSIQIMMANYYHKLAQRDPFDPVRALVDAQRLAYADRDHYYADPDFVSIPLEGLLDPRYMEHRASAPFAPEQLPSHGNPTEVLGTASVHHGADTTQEAAGTTHLSIIDKQGNAVSFTATIEAAFGSSRMVHGFLLNNELTDFAHAVVPNQAPPANVVAPNKRPRSSMSPTLIFDANDELFMVTGSPGGNSIPAYVSKSVIGVLEWGLSAQEAADHPNIIARGAKVRVETGVGNGEQIAQDLKALGYDVQAREGENSGLHLIVVREGGLEGGADSRREGSVGQLD